MARADRLRPLAELNFGRGNDCLRAALYPELLQDRRDMRLHGRFGNTEPVGNPFVEQALREPHQHAYLLRRERGEPRQQLSGLEMRARSTIELRRDPSATLQDG